MQAQLVTHFSEVVQA